MRVWVYSYKTSDGLRHEGEMGAPSKDDVYSELRRQGIRPIRVDERIVPVVKKGFRGLRKRDWSLVLVFVCGLAVLLWYAGSNSRATVGVPADKSPAVEFGVEFGELSDKLETITRNFRTMAAQVDRELLSNYALIEKGTDMTPFDAEIKRWRDIVSKWRQEVRSLYESAYEKIPEAKIADRLSAQRLYGEVMEEIDAESSELDRNECAIELLQSNRGKWSVRHGRVEWRDRKLEKQFHVFSGMVMRRSGNQWGMPRP